MSNNNWNKKPDLSTIVGNLLVIALVVIAAIIVISTPILGLYGASNILANFDLIEIRLFDNLLYNFVYFGFLFLLVFFVGVVFELLLTLIFKVLGLETTKKTMLISYIVQLFLSVIFYKGLTEDIFTRINISWIGTILLFLLIYLSSFMISDDHKIMRKSK